MVFAMPGTKNEIMELLQKHQSDLRRFGVRRLSLFGSSARGEAIEGSDLDFLVEFHKKSFDAYMDFKFFLEDLFGCKVDLVIPETIKPRMRPYITSELLNVPGL
jgi:uncharacterized protein